MAANASEEAGEPCAAFLRRVSSKISALTRHARKTPKRLVRFMGTFSVPCCFNIIDSERKNRFQKKKNLTQRRRDAKAQRDFDGKSIMVFLNGALQSTQ
ncbi:hypothetical protein JXA32_10860 [Candidatus Sumerlaeota bacterium]|nr:hypothetical protein [Candidatus Sumerlaeota bacterium]